MSKNVRVLGTLIDKEDLARITNDQYKKPVFLNNKNSYQFVIEAISETPDDFFGVKTFSVYENQLSPAIDVLFCKGGYCELSKIEEWFSKRALIFTPREQNSGHYNAENTIEVVDLPVTHNEKTKYVTLPFFDLEQLGLTLDEFEYKLHNNDWIEVFPGISKAEEDVFPMLFCAVNDSYYVYGNIVGKEFSQAGIKVFFEDNKVKRAEFDLNDGNKIISDTKYFVEFVPNELILKYEKIVELVEPNNISKPVPVKPKHKEVIDKVIENDSESSFLQQFFDVVDSEGMLYDRSDLINFHVAMKSSNLVILSGMSGTGKSRLVRLYAKALGLNEKSANRLKVIPVKPSWTDDSDLLGYLDTTNMVYRPADTGIVDVLVEAARNPNGINIICFDEMNLSRVEHYFSQFLSVLEANENERVIRLYNPNIQNRVYNSSDYPAEIKVGKNLFFVGTVNIDESTFHFSDKVLDRANVIKLHSRNFMDLQELLCRTKQNVSIKTFTMKTFTSFKKNDAAFVLTADEINMLGEINSVMIGNLANCAIGYRIIRQIDDYLKNIPDTPLFTRKQAFDNLVVQRIFTKLRGSEDQLKELVGNVDENGTLKNSIIGDILHKYSAVSEFEEAKNILAAKAKELVTYGYTG